MIQNSNPTTRVHYVYRIDRPKTGEWYIGIRSPHCAPLDDVGYWGSGARVKHAIKKHGREAFTKTVLVQVDSREEASRIEAALIGIDEIENPLCMNLQTGGDKDCRLGVRVNAESRAKMSVAGKGKRLSPEHRAKLSAALKGKKHSPEAIAKMSATKKGKKFSPEHCAALKGRKFSSEHCAKISAAAKGRECSSETRAKMSAAHKGISSETRAKMVATRKRNAAKRRETTETPTLGS